MTRSVAGALSLATVAGLLLLHTLQSHAAVADPAGGADSEQLSLLTDTPEEGFALAITLARRGVTTTQTDPDVLHALRPGYAHDADALIAVSHVVAVHFQTVAAANDYWR